MNFMIVSYYTVNTPYEQEAKEFEKSLKDNNITNYKIYPKQSNGSWVANTMIKAETILNAMNEFNKPILWLDVDCRVKDSLEYFNGLDTDVAIYYLTSKWNPHELLSGTIYFGNTDKARDILKKWIEVNKGHVNWDQKNLQKILDIYKCKKVIFPDDYIAIKGLGHFQKVKKEKVFHTQASRRLRKRIR